MKHIALATPLLLALCACGNEYDVEAAPPQAQETTAQTYVDEAQKRLERLSGQVEDLKDRLADGAAETTEGLADVRVELDLKLQAAGAELSALKDSAGDAWDSAYARVAQALDELERAIDDGLDRLADEA